MKTDIFNFRRFGRYFASDIKTCWANFGLSLLTISLLFPVIIYVITGAINFLASSTWDGPDTGLRFFVFCMAVLCMVITMPVKCYGKITEKQYGSFWLTLPASRLEKFISMIVMTCIIVPFLGVAIYLGMDAVICAFDPTCGNNLLASGIGFLKNLGDMQDLTLNFVDENVTIEDASLVQQIIGQINSPWLYIDEFFGITLPFLLGAIFFKSGKTVKTILVLFAMSTAISIIATPIMESWASSIFDNMNEDPMAVLRLFDNGFFKHLVLIDIISDTIVNAALLTGIWFRIKTLKH